jgi:hypothetical protein
MKKIIKSIKIFKKIFGFVWFWFHKLKTKKSQPNRTGLVKNKPKTELKKSNKTEKTEPNWNQNPLESPKNNIVFGF